MYKKVRMNKKKKKKKTKMRRGPRSVLEYGERNDMYKIPVCLGNKTRKKGGRVSVRLSLHEKDRI